jgi:hypothetical protein
VKAEKGTPRSGKERAMTAKELAAYWRYIAAVPSLNGHARGIKKAAKEPAVEMERLLHENEIMKAADYEALHAARRDARS